MSQTRINNLEKVLEEVFRCYESLRLLLEMECEQFLSFDAEGLIQIAAEKNSVLEQLKEAEGELLKQKGELAELWNLAREDVGLNELMENAPSDSAEKVKLLGGALLRTAKKVSTQLRLNRVMLEEGLAFVDDALTCFREAITGENAAYAPMHDSRQRKPGAVCLRREV